MNELVQWPVLQGIRLRDWCQTLSRFTRELTSALCGNAVSGKQARGHLLCDAETSAVAGSLRVLGSSLNSPMV